MKVTTTRASRFASVAGNVLGAALIALPGDAYGVARSADVSNHRVQHHTAEQKKALFGRIAELLGESPGIRPEDVFVNVLDAAKENWSVGRGLAQFA